MVGTFNKEKGLAGAEYCNEYSEYCENFLELLLTPTSNSLAFKVVDVTRSKGGASNSGPSVQQLRLRRAREAELRREVESLQVEILRVRTSRKPGYRAQSAFGTFASREFAKMLNNKVCKF